MTLFTPEVKEEIKKYLPHYIVGSAFLTASLVLSNLIFMLIDTTIHQRQDFGPGFEQQGPQEAQGPQDQGPGYTNDSDDKLPSEYIYALNYDEAMKIKSKPVIVMFFADWCQFSKKLSPVYFELSQNFENANFVTVDTQAESNYYLTKKYKVDKFPFLVVINPKTGKSQELFLNEQSFTVDGLRGQLTDSINKIKSAK